MHTGATARGRHNGITCVNATFRCMWTCKGARERRREERRRASAQVRGCEDAACCPCGPVPRAIARVYGCAVRGREDAVSVAASEPGG